MALFKTFKGLSANLMANRDKAIEGYAYFTTDDGKFYIDIAGTTDSNTDAVIGTNRIPLNSDFADRIPYAINNQNAIAYNKTITTTDPFTLKEGALILIKFTDAAPGGITNQNNSITFSVNGTGPNKVYFRSKRMPNEYLSQGKVYLFRVNTYYNTDNNQDEFIYDLVGDVIPELGSNRTVITDQNGQIKGEPLANRFVIASSLPTSGDEDDNVVYLIPTGSSSGGGSSGGSGGGSSVTYGLSKSGNTITLTGSNGTTSSVTDVGLSQSDTQALIDSTITTALSTQYPRN